MMSSASGQTELVGTQSRVDDGARYAPEDGLRGPLIAPVLARSIVAVVFGGFCVVALLFVLEAGESGELIALAVGCMLALLSLQLLYFGRPDTRLRSPRTYAVLALQALLAYLPLVLFGQSWVSMPSFLAGSMLLVFPPATAWLVFAAIVASTAWVQEVINGSALDVAYVAVSTVTAGLYVYGLTRLARLITELHAARDELAKTAVAHERLRFARDLHDLLGLSLSAIAAKGELTLRLVQKNADRARRELSEILDISRRALTDVRSTARSYRELSLDEESRTVESVLATSNVDLRMELKHRELPAHIRTMLATALREGVSNVLRHSDAERCEIILRQAGETVSLDIVNDGVGDGAGSPDPNDGTGIRNLSVLVSRIGGELAAGPDPDGRFRLHLTVPVSRNAYRSGPDPADESGEHTPRIALQLAGALAVAVFCGFFAQAVLRLLYLGSDFWQIAASVGYLLALLAVQLGYFSRPGTDLRSPPSYALLVVQAALVYLPVLQFGEAWVGLPGFLAGSVLLVLRPAIAWPVFVAITASVAWIHVSLAGQEARDIGFSIAVTVSTSLVTYGLTWMARSVSQLRAARRELAEVAVAEERLRFARDLHDLLGLSLSAITLKSELAHRLMSGDPVRAEEELAEVLDISRLALADVRSVASGYRELSLREESRSAESLLAAADVDVRMELEYGELPVRVGTVLATVLREGVTNVLRHSKGEVCEITVRQRDHVVSLDIVNDGVTDVPVGPHKGSGIHNLSDRVALLGGELTAGVDADGRFRLKASVPA